MARNLVYLVIGALVIGVAFLGYQYYTEQQKSGVEIGVDKGGVSIETK